MAKLANKYEKMIEYEDKKFYRKLKAKKKPIFMKKSWKTKKSDYLCGGDVIFFHVICDFG